MDQVALKLSKGCEDAEHQPSRNGRRIDIASQNLQVDAALLQIADQSDDVGQ
jgi:hypothetical protein